MCKCTGILWGLLAYKTCSILLFQLLLSEVCPSFRQLFQDEWSFGLLGLRSTMRAMHICCGTLLGLLGFSLSAGAHGSNAGHRTLLLLPKSGGKNRWALQERVEKVIKVPEYVSLHVTGFPETPTTPDAQTSYSSSAIYGNCMCIIRPWQKQGHLS